MGDLADDVFEALRRFVSAYSCLKIAFDVSVHPYLPSSVLGLLIRLHTQEGVEVHLANAPAEVVQITQITRLDQMLHVNQVEIGNWESTIAAGSVSTVSSGGYFVGCPSCEAEHRVDKHDLGVRITCRECQARHTVSAGMLQDSLHIYAECSQCQHELKVPHEDLKTVLSCDHCNAAIEIRTVL